VNDGKELWAAIGELRRTRRDLVSQLAQVVREASSDVMCSFCGERPPAVAIIPGPNASICDRCVGLCQEIFDVSLEAR
jgi:hypothetical protein